MPYTDKKVSVCWSKQVMAGSSPPFGDCCWAGRELAWCWLRRRSDNRLGRSRRSSALY
jgi:hypothetical protein